MRKYVISELRAMVRLGLAEDVTNADPGELLKLAAGCDKVGYSCGVYGISGGLLQDRKSGDFYAITARNSNLARVF